MTYFLAVMTVSMIDPISAIGYLLAGIFARRLWLAIVIAVAWRSALLIVLGGSAKAALPILTGAVLFTVVVFFIAKALRKGKKQPVVGSVGQL